MSEKDKKKKTVAIVEDENKIKLDKVKEPKPNTATVKEDTEAVTKSVSTKPMKPRRLINRRTGLFGRRTNHKQKLHLELLAKHTATTPIVLAALKAAYNWTDKTTLSKAEFIRLRDAWLKSPAK